jgi:hypothetical protein
VSVNNVMHNSSAFHLDFTHVKEGRLAVEAIMLIEI